jgi:polyol permease family
MSSSQPAERVSFADRIGIPSVLFWGFVGLLLFMIGDGVESSFLTPYLIHNGLTTQQTYTTASVYGGAAAIAGFLSGALSEVFGPRRVVISGLVIWIVFQAGFLAVIHTGHIGLMPMVLTYGLRGFGYPLFAYGFLVWVTIAANRHRLSSAMGWFWFAFTGGLPTLGSQVYDFCRRHGISDFNTLLVALGLVLLGGLILIFGVSEPIGRKRLAGSGSQPIRALGQAIALLGREPKTAVACVVRIINTAPEFGFIIILPLFFAGLGFSQHQYNQLLSAMFLSNIIWNLLFGLIGDRFGWRRTVAIFGGIGCTVTTLAVYYVPTMTHNYALSVGVGMLYGATLAGYVPLSALTPMLAPNHRGEALSVLSLGASAAQLVGPLLVRVFMSHVHMVGMIWIFAGLYFASALMAFTLRVPSTSLAEA